MNWAHLDIVGVATPVYSLSSLGGRRGPGRGGPLGLGIPLSPALSPLLRRGEREFRSPTMSGCAQAKPYQVRQVRRILANYKLL